MSESGDYSPGIWKGYDFGAARKVYDQHVGRSYGDAVSSGRKVKDLVSKSLSTNSESPLVIAIDVTGSMGDWPATIFSKLPYLELEGQEYLGKGMEISFAAVGDVHSDNYPLQVQPFTSEKGLEGALKKLVIEGNGGGQAKESYDLCALYYARNVKMPKAINPIFIFIGDEGLYDFVDKEYAQSIAGIPLQKRVSSKEVIEELKDKYSVYLVRKPYGDVSGDSRSSQDKVIQAQWESYLGAERISILPEAGRVVDVIFGILANETNRVDYFREELKGRQNPQQVKTVLESLHSIHRGDSKKSEKKKGHSVMPKRKKSEPSKSLI